MIYQVSTGCRRLSSQYIRYHRIFFTNFWLLLKIRDLAISHLTNYLLYNAEMPGIQTMFENGLVRIMYHLQTNIWIPDKAGIQIPNVIAIKELRHLNVTGSPCFPIISVSRICYWFSLWTLPRVQARPFLKIENKIMKQFFDYFCL